MPKSPVKLGKLDPQEIRYLAPGLVYDKRGIPRSANLPPTEVISKMSNADLVKLLKVFNIFGPWQSFVMDSMSYIQRVSSISPRSEAMITALQELTDVSSRKGLIGMCRRASENYSTLESLQGNIDQEMVWVSADDESTCSGCAQMEGEILPYSEWIQVGLPGAQVCAGGSACRCALLAVN